MFCGTCGNPARSTDFFCPICGSSLYLNWFRRSAFCFGGFGSRYHVYDYSGMMAMVITQRELGHSCSYPLHIDNYLFVTKNNQLIISHHGNEYGMLIGEDSNQSYHPVIVPPYIYMIPIRMRSMIRYVNINSIIDLLNDPSLTLPDVHEISGAHMSNEACPPAVFFDPRDPLSNSRILFWDSTTLMMLSCVSQELKDIHHIVGQNNSPLNTICCDHNGDVWFADNNQNKLVHILMNEGFKVMEAGYPGVLSAPVCVENEIFFYLSANTSSGPLTHLVKHPGTQITAFAYDPSVVHPQHLSSSPGDHPHYRVADKLTGLVLPPQYAGVMKGSLHPVWMDENGVNSLTTVSN